MRSSLFWRAGILLLLFIVALAPAAQAAGKPSGSTLSCTIDLFSNIIDEQDTSAYYLALYNDDSGYCDYGPNGTDSSAYTFFGSANFLGDQSLGYTTTLYNGFAVPWTPVPVGTETTMFGSSVVITGSPYVNGANCANNCVRATIASGGSTLNLDLNGTARTVMLDLSHPCSSTVEGWCPGTAGTDRGMVTPRGLLNVFLSSNESGATFTSMHICGQDTNYDPNTNLKSCTEARIGYAKFWYTDASGVNWRVDWDSIRVLRMAQKTWYIIADVCDGTDIAGLVQMNGKNTKGVLTGYYMVPLFIRIVAN